MKYQLEDINKASQYILQKIGNSKIIFFDAPMGSGKTTLINAICKQLGVIDTPSSPTFSIVNEYKTIDQKKIIHIDLYRVKDDEEILQLGIDDLLEQCDYCFIEWPKLAQKLGYQNNVTIQIKVLDETLRELVMQ